MTKKPDDNAKPGPKEDRLQIDGDWERAVDKALGKERPEGGWPKPKGEKKDK